MTVSSLKPRASRQGRDQGPVQSSGCPDSLHFWALILSNTPFPSSGTWKILFDPEVLSKAAAVESLARRTPRGLRGLGGEEVPGRSRPGSALGLSPAAPA